MKCAAAVAASLLLAPLTRPAEQIIQATYSDRRPTCCRKRTARRPA
jgi:hypothetical protein